jgi:phosphoribosylanthranilate isomerase
LIEARVKVKVCGLIDVGNALACAAAGADWIGLNFHPASPRSITLARGAEIASALSGKAESVGLFVDRPAREVAESAARVGVFAVQLHGEEPPEYLRELSDLLPGPIRIVRAFRLSDAASVDRMIAYLARCETLGCPPHAVLVDAHVPGHPGGTGRSIASDLLDRLPPLPRLILAGGLDPGNVSTRVARVRPWMVDVASGVETSPGVKDLARVSAFVAAARGIPGIIA